MLTIIYCTYLVMDCDKQLADGHRSTDHAWSSTVLEDPSVTHYVKHLKQGKAQPVIGLNNVTFISFLPKFIIQIIC